MKAAPSRQALNVAVISLLILVTELAVNSHIIDPSYLVMALAITALPVVTALWPRLGVVLLAVVLAVLLVTDSLPGLLWFTYVVIVGVLAIRGRVWLSLIASGLLAVNEILSALNSDSGFRVEGTFASVVICAAIVAMGTLIHRSNQRAAADAAAARARREALSWELHDNVANSLTSIVTRAELHAMSLGEQSEHYPEARGIAEAARGSVSELRTMLNTLGQEKNEGGEKEAGRKTVSLHSALDSAVDQLEAVGFDVVWQPSDDYRVPPQQAEVVRQCLGEAVVNVIKYGDRADPVSIDVSLTPELLVIRIANAIMDTVPTTDSSRLGLNSMSAKLAAAGGGLTVQDGPEEWVLQMEIPAP